MPSMTDRGEDATVVDIAEFHLRSIAANADALTASIEARRRKDQPTVGLCIQLALAINRLLEQEKPHRDNAITVINTVREHLQPESELRLYDAGKADLRPRRKRRR